MFTEKTVGQFLDELASKSPTPGGGSVSALVGALGAGLVSMVCHLTLGKEKYKDVEPEMASLLERSEKLRHRLMDLMEADVAVYDQVSAARKLPRDTEPQKQARTAAIQASLIKATEVPLSLAETCVEVLNLCPLAAEKGNVAAVSDAGVGALLAEAALRGAALNVLINLSTIKDETFVQNARQRLDHLLADKGGLKEQVYRDVVAKL